MAEIDRRRRFAGRLKPLINVAVEQKNVGAGVSLARLIMQLEGWLPASSKDDLPQEPQPAPDMSALLNHITQVEGQSSDG